MAQGEALVPPTRAAIAAGLYRAGYQVMEKDRSLGIERLASAEFSDAMDTLVPPLLNHKLRGIILALVCLAPGKELRKWLNIPHSKFY